MTVTAITNSSIPGFLVLSQPTLEEKVLLDKLDRKLQYHAAKNTNKLALYDGSYSARQFGISIPPTMQGVPTPVGWAGSTVDILEERLDWLGWTTEGEDLGLDAVYTENSLDVDSSLAHLDALIAGTAFVEVGTGYTGEPGQLVTMHSPNAMTALWNPRTRRLHAALLVTKDEDSSSPFGATAGLQQPDSATLYMLNQNVILERIQGQWHVVDRDEHNMNRVSVVQLENRARTGIHGRSEITEAVTYYCDAAMRTLLGLEVSREFYNAPKIAALNVVEEMFQDSAGNKVSQWTSIMGRIWNAPPNAPGEAEPKLQVIPAASPLPYLDQIKGYASLVASESGFPESYLGLHTDNPSSADAIRAAEARLVKRAERRQKHFGRAWMEVARLVLLARDGEINPAVNLATPRWRDAATPTRAASADEATKLVATGILTPDSQVTYDRIGLSPAEQRQITAEKRRLRASSMLGALVAVNQNQQGVTDADSIT